MSSLFSLALVYVSVACAGSVSYIVDNSLGMPHDVAEGTALQVDFNDTALNGTSIRFDKAERWYFIDMQSAQNFAVIGGAGVTNSGATQIMGDLGTYPSAAISGAPTVSGMVHAADAAALQAKNDATTVSTTLSGMACHQPVFQTEDIGGLTLTPGVYCWASASASILTDLYLDGANDPHATFVFVVASDLVVETYVQLHLSNGANPCNIYWSIYAGVTLRTGVRFYGTIIAGSTIAMQLDATLIGRAISTSGAVTMLANTVDISECSTFAPSSAIVSVNSMPSAAFASEVNSPIPAGGVEMSVGFPAGGSPVALQVNVSQFSSVFLTLRPLSTFELVNVTGSGLDTNLRVLVYDSLLNTSALINGSLDQETHRISVNSSVQSVVTFRFFYLPGDIAAATAASTADSLPISSTSMSSLDSSTAGSTFASAEPASVSASASSSPMTGSTLPTSLTSSSSGLGSTSDASFSASSRPHPSFVLGAFGCLALLSIMV
jgi:hypothetical protein